VSSRVEAAAYRTRYLSDLVTSSDSRYYALDSRVTWRVSERWTLEGGYRHARQKYDTAPVAANGNAVYVQLGYAWPKLSVSR
jgi:outer membrane receptor protein involved in Fe transport